MKKKVEMLDHERSYDNIQRTIISKNIPVIPKYGDIQMLERELKIINEI